ncbi:glycerate kinase [Aquibacillus sediminis]|uniref:glycerate kinase n=1 Tax=Aquibacillus sediminis TaxID=2574734 RepID=UPI001109D279|nr:glycerate kinase [Aquibacillus sediminis]
MNIVIAPDSFKGSLTSLEAANIIRKAVNDTEANDRCVMKPMADGGEGTIDAFLTSVGGRRIQLTCKGPLGADIETNYAILNDQTAVIEVASVAGLVQVPSEQRDPDRTTTYGIGQVMMDALDKGCRSFIIGLGGSATNDVGFGMFQALGMKAWSRTGAKLGYKGHDLLDIDQLDLTGLDPRLQQVSIQVACDVDNPLTGQTGASAVYGPQKGASAEQVTRYDHAHAYFAKLVDEEKRDLPGAGAAGGLGFALLTLGATLKPGANVIAEIGKVEQAIRQADLIITGEGQSDEQTLYGKAPAHIADLAKKHNKKVLLISGSLGNGAEALHDKFTGCFSIMNRPMTLEACIEHAGELLYEQTKHVMYLVRSLEDC